MSPTSAPSANRKYTQLTVEDVEHLAEHMNCLTLSPERVVEHQWLIRMRAACTEMRDRARLTPNPHICLAYAVVRRQGTMRPAPVPAASTEVNNA